MGSSLTQPMQKQIQQERTYSFEEICPDFSHLVAKNGGFMKTQSTKYKSKNGIVRDMMECKSCIVGEAHGN